MAQIKQICGQEFVTFGNRDDRWPLLCRKEDML